MCVYLAISPKYPLTITLLEPSSKGSELTGIADHGRLKAFPYQHDGYTFPLTELPLAFLRKTSEAHGLSPEVHDSCVSRPHLEFFLGQNAQDMCLRKGLCPQASCCPSASSMAWTGTGGSHHGLW